MLIDVEQPNEAVRHTVRHTGGRLTAMFGDNDDMREWIKTVAIFDMMRFQMLVGLTQMKASAQLYALTLT